MNSRYIYTVYGMTIDSNIELPLLTPANEIMDTSYTLEYRASEKIINNYGINIKYNNSLYTIALGEFATYSICARDGHTVCTAKDYESCFSTLFNIPSAVLIAIRQEVLLHACSLFYNDGIHCLTANKGVGKSTLTQLLGDGLPFKIFSDDTVRISRTWHGYAPHNLIKLTDETKNALKVDDIYDSKNIAGKIYGKFTNGGLKTPKVRSIIQIKRTTDDLPAMKYINDLAKKRKMFFGNLVGIPYYTKSLLNNAFDFKIESDVNFYTLFIPNGLIKLINAREYIKNLVVSTISKHQC